MNILITSVGRRSYIIEYFKEALKGIGHVHACNSSDTYALNTAYKKFISPLIYDDNYVDFLVSYCVENKINALISLFDIDLRILASNINKFYDNGIHVVISDYKTVQICNDKWLTYNFLINNGFNTPQTFLCIKKFKEALNKGSIQFPVIIKPRWGMGSISIFQVDNLDELEILYIKTKNSIFNSYLKFESSIDPENCVLIQERLSGDEYGLDVFNDLNGKFMTCVPKIKLGMRAGETDSAEIIEDSTLFELGQMLSKKLKHNANLDVDCFKVDCKNYILEMNCRFGGQYPFSHLAGVNFPKAIINLLLERPVEKELLSVKFGTRGFKDILPTKLHK